MKVAVVLSGCGFNDGAEISESVLLLLQLSRIGCNVQIFAPDVEFNVVDHLTEIETQEKRNALTEAARIARGKIQSLAKLSYHDYDSLFLSGGFGVAKNLSNLSSGGNIVNNDLDQILHAFNGAGKPIGGICFAAAVIGASLGKDVDDLSITLGDKSSSHIAEQFGCKYLVRGASEVGCDWTNKVFTTPAYMISDAPLADIDRGIARMVYEVKQYV